MHFPSFPSRLRPWLLPGLLVAALALAVRDGGWGRPSAVAEEPNAKQATAKQTNATQTNTAKNDAAQAQAFFQQEIAPFLARYCADCHSGDDGMAGVTVDRYTKASQVQEHRKEWEKMLRMLRTGLMPPPESQRPTAPQADLVIRWIEDRLTNVDCSGPRNAGRTTIRRLNRTEYDNTIRDLVGVDFHPASDFPADDVGYGFDNIGDVLTLPPILFEKYLDAAEVILDRAIVSDQDRGPKVVALDIDKFQGGQERNSLRGLNSSGEVFTDYEIPHAGNYVIRIVAGQDKAGKDHAKMEVRLDGKPVKTIEVPASRRDPKPYEIRLRLPQGKHRLAAAFTNDFYDPKNPDPNNRDRNLYVGAWEIDGPHGLPPVPPSEAEQKIIFIKPDAQRTPKFCAWEIFQRFANRAYRRPVQREELFRMVELFERAQKSGESFERSIKIGLQAILVSPHFLFRVEADPPPGETRPISEHELATRLSYFLWSSIPDDELRRLADAGQLRANLDEQVRRMIADPKSDALVENFGDQWLQIRNLDTISVDRKQFPAWNAELKEDMRRESRLFLGHVFRNDASLFELLHANYTFINERLANHYGLPGVKGDEFRKVSLADGRRGGVLTQASVLTITSSPTRTSPVKRGKWIMEQILGTEPPPPPPDVEELKEDGPLTGTLRERMEQHRQNPNCAVCHVQMDALGFGFENFDPIGAWRDKEGQFDIDASGELPGGQRFNGPGDLKQILSTNQDAFRRSFSEKLLTYALGRGIEPYDYCTVEDLRLALASSGDRFIPLVLAIARSDAFQKRHQPEAASDAATSSPNPD